MISEDTRENSSMSVIKKFFKHPLVASFCERLGFQKGLRKEVLYLWRDSLLIKVSTSRDGRTVYFDLFLLEHQKTASLNSLLAKSALVEKPPEVYQRFMKTFVPTLSEDEGLAFEKNFIFYLHITESVFLQALVKPSTEFVETCFQDSQEQDIRILGSLVSGEYEPVYYELRVSEDPAVMGGSYPLINGIEEKGLGQEPPDMSLFLMRVGAKDVDFYSSAYLKGKGLFISEKLAEHFPNYRLKNCHLEDVEVNKAYPQKRKLKFARTTEQDELIDFSLSNFVKKHDDGRSEVLTYPHSEACLKDISQAINEQLPYRVKPQHLYLHRYPDLLRLAAYPVNLISADFLKLLKAQGMAGYTVHRVPFQIR